VLHDHGVQFIGNWTEGKLVGNVVLKNPIDGTEKKAIYSEGKFVEWMDNDRQGAQTGMTRESGISKKKGKFSCCIRGNNN